MEEQPRTEIGQERSPFPVSKEACEQALRTIASNPSNAVMLEGLNLHLKNPDLGFRLLRNVERGNVSPYQEGFIFTHMILRLQSERNGGNLPKISSDAIKAFLENRLQELRSKEPPLSRTIHEEIVEDRIMTEEPELGKAIIELTRYKLDKERFYGGVADIYDLFKGDQETKQLKKEMGI